jgi:hypothetical protein
MNRIHRALTTTAAVLVAAASTIGLAGSAFACQIVVDPFTGTPQCTNTVQPTSAASTDSWPWLEISIGVLLVVTAVVLLVRRRFVNRAPAPAQPQPDNRTEFSAAKPADTRARLAELEAELQDQRHENARLRNELELLQTT